MKTMFSCFLPACSLCLLASAAPRPVEITNTFGWKRIQTPNVSSDGTWFAYRMKTQTGGSSK